MLPSIERRALGISVFSAALSLVGAWLTALLIQVGSSSSGQNPSPTADTSAVVGTPELVAQGHAFYGQSCSHCHGDDATGDEGPNLHHLSISNGRIAATIKKGIKGEMPTFAKKYNDQQIAALVSYLRTLQ